MTRPWKRDGMNSYVHIQMKIELPFNFNIDGQYFNLLDSRIDHFKDIDCVYFSSFENGGTNTRESLVTYPETEKEYCKYIKEFQDRKISVNILIQRNASLDLIRKYHLDYGINDFTINDHTLAADIKEEYPDIKLRMSLTSRVTPKEIGSSILNPYDNIILFFWYNRHLDVIKELPKNHEYTILCNTICLWNCQDCEKHWFGHNVTEITNRCFKKKILWGDTLQFKNTAYIRPEDIKYFEDYVSVFKLEGREHKSTRIFNDFDKYISGSSGKGRPLHGFDNRDIISNYNIK